MSLRKIEDTKEFSDIHKLAEQKLEKLIKKTLKKIAPGETADLEYKINISKGPFVKPKRSTTTLNENVRDMMKQEFVLAEFVNDFSTRLKISSGSAHNYKFTVDGGDSSNKFKEEFNNTLVIAAQELKKAHPDANVKEPGKTKAGSATYMHVIDEAIRETFAPARPKFDKSK